MEHHAGGQRVTCITEDMDIKDTTGIRFIYKLYFGSGTSRCCDIASKCRGEGTSSSESSAKRMM